MNKIVSLFLLLTFVLLPVNAKNIVNSKAQVHTEYNIKNEDTSLIEFSPNQNIKISKDVDIPPNAKIQAQIIQSQKERRWHKSGFIICKLLNFTLEGITVDISQYDAYLIARKYEPVDKKEAAIIATELIVMQGASFFAPGVDIGYFFAKGAIQRKKHKNWFRAGVMNAYENSICWFWLKGKPINLSKNDQIKLKYLEKTDAKDISAKIRYKKDMASFKKERKIVKAEVKTINKAYKEEIAQVERKNKTLLKEHDKMVKMMAKTVKQRKKIALKSNKEKR